MKYVGSKNRISKELAPLIQSHITNETVAYIEPFVGGANMIDKIKHHNKIGSDIHKELIALHVFNRDNSYNLPETITEETYKKVKDNKEKYPDWFVGLVGFCATFGAKYYGGYARGFKADKITPRDIPNEGISNLKKQAPNIQGIEFNTKSFLDYNPNDYNNCVFYLDPPYRDTLGYSSGKFPFKEFDEWALELAKNNTVLISEYNIDDDRFKCIWEKDVTMGIDGKNKNRKRTEKLFIVK